MSSDPERALRPELQRVVDEFASAPRALRLDLLLDYAGQLAALPSHLTEHPDRLTRVHECQTPFFVATEAGPDGRIALHFDAPPEAPTTRGYAGVLQTGLSGARAEEILSTPPHFFIAMGLQELISPLRLRGMGAILAHIKRQLTPHLD